MANFSFFFLLTTLLCTALATVPKHVYRADTRGPGIIKAAGGFKGFGNSDAITVIEHVTRQYEKGHRQGQDPWISTSAVNSIACQPVADKPCWLYTIDNSSIASRFTEVAQAFASANQPNGHAPEQEWAAKNEIPLTSITEFHRHDKTGKTSKAYTWESYDESQKAKQAEKASSSKGSGSKKSHARRDSAGEEGGYSRCCHILKGIHLRSSAQNTGKGKRLRKDIGWTESCCTGTQRAAK